MKASKLKKGDYIGVCAPSGCIKEKHKFDLLKSETFFGRYGIKVVYPRNLYANNNGYSASVQEKSDDINNLIENKDIKAIVFAKGGNNSNAILDKINYDVIKNNPKFYVGFSDNTVLLNAIYAKTGLITYHFTNYKGFCEENLDFNTNQFENVFINGNKGIVSKNSEWKSIRVGVAKGKTVGGNLASLVKIINTEYCPDFKDKILFLEDLAIESTPEMVSSYLHQLKLCGVFDKISGLLLGYYNSQEKINFEDIILDVTNDYEFPIVKCDDFGHTANNIVLPIGLNCILDANKCELFYEENTAV